MVVNLKEPDHYKLTSNGRSFNEILKHYSIKIPIDASPTQLKSIAARASILLQEAYRSQVQANSDLEAYQLELETQVNKEFKAIVSQYKKEGKGLPLKGILEKIAKTSHNELLEVVTSARLIKTLYDTVIKQIGTVLKMIETMTVNTGYEIKLTDKSNYYEGSAKDVLTRRDMNEKEDSGGVFPTNF